MSGSSPLQSALQRVADLANQLSKGPANAHELVRELFVAFFDVIREEHWKPQPIRSAPKEAERTLLLYCPEQGGWQTGEWLDDRKCWVSTAAIEECLEPTLWSDVPPDPGE